MPNGTTRRRNRVLYIPPLPIIIQNHEALIIRESCGIQISLDDKRRGSIGGGIAGPPCPQLFTEDIGIF
jgi:hypothetical protein